MEIKDRFIEYNKDHCWQYDIRLKNIEEDLKLSNLTELEIKSLEVKDFAFSYVDKTNIDQCKKIKEFIERHEWLGKLGLYPTHRFIATYKGILAGVVIMDQPNTFSKLLGEDTKKIERLISRGACISWSPKGLASSMIMFAIRWMVQNTRYRLFTAYSDVEAKELGTIYQACNFTYLGKTSGTQYMFLDPNNKSKNWFSDRSFRSRSAWKKYARELGIEWLPEWQGARYNKLKDHESETAVTRTGKEIVLWENIPADIVLKLKQASKDHQKKCDKRKAPAKHKYAYILGRSKKETKTLKSLFETRNPKMVGLKYPKNRG